MATALLITFRETLEASLIIVVVLAVLERMRRRSLRLAVWHGITAGLVASLLVALLVQWMFRELPAAMEPIAEGVVMLAAACLITWMVFWMTKNGRSMHREVDSEATGHVQENSWWGIFLMSFFAVAREGTETVLFLQASVLYARELVQEIGAIIGITAALGFSFLLYRGLRFLPLKWVFQTTSILLIVFAISLFIGGFHEMYEALEGGLL